MATTKTTDDVNLVPVVTAMEKLGGISRDMIDTLLNNGELTRIKIGARVFIEKSDLSAYVRRQANRSRAAKSKQRRNGKK